MTKQEFMKVTDTADEEELETYLLMMGWKEPENGDWIDLTCRAFQTMQDFAGEYVDRYLDLRAEIG